MKVRLTNEAIEKIKFRIRSEKNRQTWHGLNASMNRSKTSTRIYDLVKANEWNGDLTKESALQYLEERLNMTRFQLLEITE